MSKEWQQTSPLHKRHAYEFEEYDVDVWEEEEFWIQAFNELDLPAKGVYYDPRAHGNLRIKVRLVFEEKPDLEEILGLSEVLVSDAKLIDRGWTTKGYIVDVVWIEPGLYGAFKKSGEWKSRMGEVKSIPGGDLGTILSFRKRPE